MKALSKTNFTVLLLRIVRACSYRANTPLDYLALLPNVLQRIHICRSYFIAKITLSFKTSFPASRPRVQPERLSFSQMPRRNRPGRPVRLRWIGSALFRPACDARHFIIRTSSCRKVWSGLGDSRAGAVFARVTPSVSQVAVVLVVVACSVDGNRPTKPAKWYGANGRLSSTLKWGLVSAHWQARENKQIPKLLPALPVLPRVRPLSCFRTKARWNWMPGTNAAAVQR